ncbi:SCO3374 family protein, partial [Streptomyces sp. NPDC059385]|uniref:SCO3374 family protein n=1 Tax=Streptomyces sp. NPDC059385 TaxID=3346817 RepID=UPI00368A3F56
MAATCPGLRPAGTPPQNVAPTARPVARAVPGPRTPPGEETCAGWYERVLGWTVLDPAPGRLATGTRFDVLELPSDAGAALLRRPVPTGPVALAGCRMHFLVAAGGAEELDGLLDWLEWGGVALDLVALGAGGRISAPAPPGTSLGKSPRGAAVWLRPPEQGCEALLPALPGPGRVGGGGGGGAGAPGPGGGGGGRAPAPGGAGRAEGAPS